MTTNPIDKSQLETVYDKTAKYYDLMHGLGTLGLDHRGRSFLLKETVKNGDQLLDVGGGTGATAIAALRTLPDTRATILDFSEGMLERARKKATAAGVSDRLTVRIGDMFQLPFSSEHFDVVLSTYSTCPLEDPNRAVTEMLRVLKCGGLLGIAHSAEPENPIARKLTRTLEQLIGRFPRLSLGCRPVDLGPSTQSPEVELIENRLIGFIPWYFRLLILRKGRADHL